MVGENFIPGQASLFKTFELVDGFPRPIGILVSKSKNIAKMWQDDHTPESTSHGVGSTGKVEGAGEEKGTGV